MFVRVFDYLFYFINLFFIKCCLNYVVGHEYFQFATCGGFKACATKGLHFSLVNLSTCLVPIDVFFVQDTGNLMDMAACVSQPFFCSKIKCWNALPLTPISFHFFLSRWSSSSSSSSSHANLLLHITPISSSSSSALRSIILFHFYSFALLPFLSMCAFYCFVYLTVSHIKSSFFSSHPLEQKTCK